MPIVPGHNRNLPDGAQIALALQALWREQAQRFARTGEVESIQPTADEDQKLQQIFGALLGPLWRQAWLEALYRVRLSAMNAGREPVRAEMRAYRGVIEICAGPVKKDLQSFAVGFDIYNEEITHFIETQVYHFLRSINDTSEELLRTTLFVAESEGYSPMQRTAAVQEIFHDPKRSFTIAQTESSRAVHGGEYEATTKTGLADRKQWLASSDACPRCLKLARLGKIPIDQPFDASGSGAYKITMYPPVHPHDMCTVKYILAKSPEE